MSKKIMPDRFEQEKVRKLRKETAAAIGESQILDILDGVNFNDVSADFQEWLRDENRDENRDWLS